MMADDTEEQIASFQQYSGEAHIHGWRTPSGHLITSEECAACKRPAYEQSDLTTPEGRLEILVREPFPWSPEASTMACQTIRGLLAERGEA
jgi:hypothetical protein